MLIFFSKHSHLNVTLFSLYFFLREGAIFGLGLAMSSLQKEATNKARVESVYSKMIEYLEVELHHKNIAKIQVYFVLKFLPFLSSQLLRILVLSVSCELFYFQVLGVALAYSSCLAGDCPEIASLKNTFQLMKTLVQTFPEV